MNHRIARSFIGFWRHWPLAKIVHLGLLGFSAGIPILLIFSTLSLWLNEAGVEKSAVTYFSWAALGYSFKFVWAPIVDQLPLPLLSRCLGRRRSWLLLSQCLVICSILWMASIDPAYSLVVMAFAAVALGFSSATQDIVIDTYRIEYAEVNVQALLSSGYIAGYRIGMIVAGAGGLYLADIFGSSPEAYLYSAWQKTYWFMTSVMFVGVLTTLYIPEPKFQGGNIYPYSTTTYLRFFGVFLLSVVLFITVFQLFPTFSLEIEGYAATLIHFLIEAMILLIAIVTAVGVGFLGSKYRLVDRRMLVESYYLPVSNFFSRYGQLAVWVLLLIGFYRVSDIVMGVIANLFYQNLGYSKTEIASITKVFGLLMTILGSFLGGFLVLRWGVMKILLLGAILSAMTNIIFVWLSVVEPTLQALTVAIVVDNLSAGLAVAAFLAWLSSLTSISFTATQFALFSSIMTLFPKLLGGYSGSMVENVGYSAFFLFTALLGVPIIILILFLQKHLQIKE
ncbi:MFS transporter [Candidatus Endobugula sertula]|uniref:MFS transporter n=1 Tax=Candidatus Endobugula sertula TaxID=62101 RepID=A0A1D2QQ28_9GAMM|nr:MFS transporter [Candidatus Endobugula sertula]